MFELLQCTNSQLTTLDNCLETASDSECNCIGSYVHVSVYQLVCELHWLLMIFWVQFKMLMVTYKALPDVRSGYPQGHPSPISLYICNIWQNWNAPDPLLATMWSNWFQEVWPLCWSICLQYKMHPDIHIVLILLSFKWDLKTWLFPHAQNEALCLLGILQDLLILHYFSSGCFSSGRCLLFQTCPELVKMKVYTLDK